MTASIREVAVKCIRLQWADQTVITTFKQDVTVVIAENPETKTSYLTINVNGQPRLSEALNKCQWLPKSAIDGIAAVVSASAKIVIMYDTNDARQRDFVANLKDKLEKNQPTDLPGPSALINPPRDIGRSASLFREPRREREWTVDNLMDSIERGSADDAQYAAQYLAKSRTDVQLNLLTRGSQKKVVAADRSIPNDALKLNVEIESDLSQTPTRIVIGVRQGTTLRSLKEQIAKQTNFAFEDQFWFAFDRYPIRDDYVFGSAQPVVALRPRPANSDRPQPPTDPIQSGSTLVLYIARVTPL